ncbi:MAG: DUF3300 domain-containing protein [Rhizomicrobium sp.]
MKSARLHAIAVLMSAAAIVSSGSVAQDAPPPVQQTAATAPSLTQQQLDQLVAPVALYPDPLLADVLTASTYPLEVVEAHRWVSDPANAALKGDALSAALAAHDWAPSIQALVPFPMVLQMMDSHLDWTEQLGEAFLAQQGDIMDAVQRLRHRAEMAGTLTSSPQQTVASEGDDVTISPPPSEVIYVPTYNAWCAYGAWPYQVYPPYYYAPWPGYCAPDDYAIAFDAGLFLPFAYWDWGYFDWHGHHLRINRDRYDQFHSGHEPAVPDHQAPGDVWQHNPAHRVGVPYRDLRNAQQFQPAQNDHQSFRGFEGRDSEPFESVRPSPPAFENFGSGREIQMQSERGQSSRGVISGSAPRSFGGGGRSSGGHGRP